MLNICSNCIRFHTTRNRTRNHGRGTPHGYFSSHSASHIDKQVKLTILVEDRFSERDVRGGEGVALVVEELACTAVGAKVIDITILIIIRAQMMILLSMTVLSNLKFINFV